MTASLHRQWSPKVRLLLILATGVSLCAPIPLPPLTDSESNIREHSARQCDRLRRESVARLTANIPVKSDICFQSSPLSSLQQLPWKPQCHFPHCLERPISWKLFSESCFIKGGETGSESWFLLQYFLECVRMPCVSLGFYTCACTQVHKPVNVLHPVAQIQAKNGGRPSLDLYSRQTWLLRCCIAQFDQ